MKEMQRENKLDNQKDEQLHMSYNHDSRYLNQMKHINHVFLFRSNIDINNEKINQPQENGLTSAFNDHIRRDRNGQALLEKSKTKKTSNAN